MARFVSFGYEGESVQALDVINERSEAISSFGDCFVLSLLAMTEPRLRTTEWSQRLAALVSKPFNLVRDGVIGIFVVEVDFRYPGADKLLDYFFSLSE